VRATARGLAAGCLAAALGCAATVAPAYLDALAAGDRALVAGRSREAAEAYERAVREARRARDRDEAEYRAGQALARLGATGEALDRFDRVAARSPDFERGARAAYEAATIRCAAEATREAGLTALAALVRERPATGPARLAVTALLRADDARDATRAASLARIDGLLAEAAVRATPLRETLRAEQARRLAETGREAEAERAWRTLFEEVPYPQNSRWDDGHVALATLLRRRGDARGAVAALDAMLAPRDPACVGGTCDAPLFQEGAMLRGEILRDELRDPRAAARAFRAAYEMFPASRVRDDALEAEARCLDAAGDPRACAVWRELAAGFPCTRRGRHARQRAAACGEPTPPADERCERTAPAVHSAPS
jgi:tetratricopeptide (TPR) repeat protein